MTKSLLERSREKGARLERRGRGAVAVHGHRWTGAVMAVEAVQEDIQRWCEEVDDD